MHFVLFNDILCFLFRFFNCFRFKRKLLKENSTNLLKRLMANFAEIFRLNKRIREEVAKTVNEPKKRRIQTESTSSSSSSSLKMSTETFPNLLLKFLKNQKNLTRRSRLKRKNRFKKRRRVQFQIKLSSVQVMMMMKMKFNSLMSINLLLLNTSKTSKSSKVIWID